jgi:segregation and condensation protein A
VTDAVVADEAAAAVAERDLAAVADDAWDDPPRAAAVASTPVLSVEGFEGPLDWLLERVRVGEIDLARLSILALIEAFIAAMQTAFRHRDGTCAASLARWGDWLVMAATLLQLRSRLLLPAHDPKAKAARNQAETLRRQLLSRAHIAAAADWLTGQPQLGRDVFARGGPEVADATADVNSADSGGDLTMLLRACLLTLQLPEPVVAAYRLPSPTLWPISDAIARMRQRLAALPDGSPMTDYLPPNDKENRTPLRHRAAVASTLIAGLMLAQDGQLSLDQDETWRPIRLSHNGGKGAVDKAGAAKRGQDNLVVRAARAEDLKAHRVLDRI